AGYFGAMLRTTDGGLTWNAQNAGSSSYFYGISQIDSLLAFAVTSGGEIYQTTDAGASWALQTIPSTRFWGVDFSDPNNGTAVGDNGAIFHTVDGGVNWHPHASNISRRLYGVSFANNEVGTVVGVHGTIVRIEDASTVTGINILSGNIPSEFSLGQNYPNPFNPTTVIRYSSSVKSAVTLKVYNMLGQEVAALVNEELQPGIYNVQWDASGLPSGVYFYRISAVGQDGILSYTDVKRMLLIK
ncbi:MAG: T9SS type A sorting domain-containing protein, partial [Bacteroidetes bacterium]